MINAKFDEADRVQALLRLQTDYRPSTQDVIKSLRARSPIGRLGAVNAVPASQIRKPEDPFLLGIDGTRDYRIAKGNEDDLLDGEKLFLVLDLTRPKEELKNSINEYLDFYGKLVKNRVKAKKPVTVDPWTVYDLHVYAQLSFPEIARRLSGLSGTPSNSYNPELEKVYKNVLSAYTRAKEVMEHVKKLTDTSKN